MIKYFLIDGIRLVKGYCKDDRFNLVHSAFEYRNKKWKEINTNVINDRLMGYDPTEDSIYGIGNTEIMDSIEEITEEKAKELL